MADGTDNLHGHNSARNHSSALLAAWLGGIMASGGGYVVLSGSAALAQAVAGGFVAIGSFALLARICRAADVDLRLPPLWIARSLAAFAGQLLPDTWRVTQMLVGHFFGRQPLCGHFRRMAFDAGGDNPADAGRRALVLVAISWTPNTYAIRRLRKHGQLLIHQLGRTPLASSQDPRWPI